MPKLPQIKGKTREEAIARAREAIELYLASCKAHNESIPEESELESLVVEVKEPVASGQTGGQRWIGASLKITQITQIT